jgi:hypothetical protein
MRLITLKNSSVVFTAAETLGNILRESKWDRIIGIWVDADTKGAKSITTYAWKFKNKTVLEATTKYGEKETVALIGVKRKTGEVYHMGVDSKGTHSLGRWRFEKAKAVLELEFAMAKSKEEGLRVLYMLEDNDTMIVTIDLPEPIIFKRVRLKNEEHQSYRKGE